VRHHDARTRLVLHSVQKRKFFGTECRKVLVIHAVVYLTGMKNEVFCGETTLISYSCTVYAQLKFVWWPNNQVICHRSLNDKMNVDGSFKWILWYGIIIIIPIIIIITIYILLAEEIVLNHSHHLYDIHNSLSKCQTTIVYIISHRQTRDSKGGRCSQQDFTSALSSFSLGQ
jgi:uncharacterized metal-binding protein